MKAKEEKKEGGIQAPKDMVVVDPNVPLYSRQHLCIYLRELYDMAEAEAEGKTDEEKRMAGEKI